MCVYGHILVLHTDGWMCVLDVCPGDIPGDSEQLPLSSALQQIVVPGSHQVQPQRPGFKLSLPGSRPCWPQAFSSPPPGGLGVGGRGRPRLARSSWLIFPAAIDPAASPESISSRQVKISPIESPDLRQGGIHSNLFKQRRVIPSHFYSNLVQGEGGQAGRPELDPGLVRWVFCASQGGSWCYQ